MPTGLKIAVAASGLTHIARGVESWAADTAAALQRAGENVTLFCGTGPSDPPFQQSLDCTPRGDPYAIAWARRLHGIGLWRAGITSPYDFEQLSFTRRLWRAIRRDFDILHVQDPMVAMWMTWLHRLGWSRPVAILGHGTEETPRILRRYQALQHLSPVYLADWEEHRPPGQAVFAIPNFIDVNRFRPGDQAAGRAAWNLPADAFIVLCVAALKKSHKRMDYLIREMAQLPQLGGRTVMFVAAGAREADTPEILDLSAQLLGDRGRMFLDIPRDRMVSLYHAADAFVLGSLHEMLGTAIVEAMACGLPVCCNNSPTLAWVAGPSAVPNCIAEPGALVAQLMPLASPEECRRRGVLARQRAEELFSEQAVVPQMQAMYRAVLE